MLTAYLVAAVLVLLSVVCLVVLIRLVSPGSEKSLDDQDSR